MPLNKAIYVIVKNQEKSHFIPYNEGKTIKKQGILPVFYLFFICFSILLQAILILFNDVAKFSLTQEPYSLENVSPAFGTILHLSYKNL